MARKPLRPLIRSGGFYPSRKWTPLVYAGGYTTANGGEEPAPPPIEKTITGNPIHILDALAKPAQALSVKLEPVQDLNGYSYPWPAGGGKNLFDNSASKIVSGSSFANVVGDTINNTATSAYAAIRYEFFLESGTYTLSCADISTGYFFQLAKYNSGSYTDKGKLIPTYKAMTVALEAGTYRLSLYTANANNPGYITKVQLELGSTATAYEPYSNICPISGWTGAKVTRTGKNLFDGTFIAGTMIVDSTGEYYANAYHKCSNKILAKENTVYTLSGTDLHKRSGTATNAANVTIAYYKVDGTYIRREAPDTSTNTYKTVTTPANTAFVIFQVGGQATNVMLEESATETTYEPFGTTYPISWQTEAGTVYGGTLDVVSGLLTVDRAGVDLGTLTWEVRYAETNNKTIRTNLPLTLPHAQTRKIISENYKYQGAVTGASVLQHPDNLDIGLRTYYKEDRLGYDDIVYAVIPVSESPDGLLVYELATPQTYQLTPTEVTLLLGENNIWSDGEMTLTYLADGNASDEEALNILLGGRYVNNHSEDEPTDREALDILLGGTR